MGAIWGLRLRFKLLRLYSRWQDWREGTDKPFSELPHASEHQRIIGRTRTTIRKYSPFKGLCSYRLDGDTVRFSVNVINRQVFWPVHSLTIPPERWRRLD